ncbi:MAG: hypothetical protein ABSH48_24975 [Verrucomicrobiota bacterium]
MKQLQLGAILYAGDNTDFMPQNTGSTDNGGTLIGVEPCSPNWVGGQWPWNGSPPNWEDTNVWLLGVVGLTDPSGVYKPLAGTIGGYAKAQGSYKCPADLSTAFGVPRVRSCSANEYVGTSPSTIKFDSNLTLGYRCFIKSSDFNSRLSASDCFEFLDENPNSLNDGYFEYIPNGDSVNDRPAINHGKSSSFSFADGHAALHKWQDTFLVNSVSDAGLVAGIDTHWLAQHGTYSTTTQ